MRGFPAVVAVREKGGAEERLDRRQHSAQARVRPMHTHRKEGRGEEHHGQKGNRLHDRVVLVGQVVERLWWSASNARKGGPHQKTAPHQIDFVLESLLIRLRPKLQTLQHLNLEVGVRLGLAFVVGLEVFGQAAVDLGLVSLQLSHGPDGR